MGSLCPSRASGCINEQVNATNVFFFSLFFQRYPSRWRCLPASPWLMVQERVGPAYVMVKTRGARHRTATSLGVVVGVTVLFPILFPFRRKAQIAKKGKTAYRFPQANNARHRRSSINSQSILVFRDHGTKLSQYHRLVSCRKGWPRRNYRHFLASSQT